MKLAFALLFLVAGSPAAGEDAQCVSNYGQTACGYHCLSNYGQVKCARTPAGVCAANYGQVVCWDPPRTRRHRRHPGEPAECLANYGTIACGYGCVANYGQVKCAQQPGGRCFASYGRLFCSDGS